MAFQREQANGENVGFVNAYLDLVKPEEEQDALGAVFCFREDCGVTFGTSHKSPVTSPHGPLPLEDGSLLWVGRVCSSKDAQRIGINCIQAHGIYLNDSMEYVGRIDNIEEGGRTAAFL